MASEVALQLKACLVLPLVTKLFGAANYGIWSQVEVLQSLLAPLVIMGLDSASMRFASGKPEDEVGRASTSVLAYILGTGLILGAMLWATSRPLAASFFGGLQNSSFVMLCVPALLAMGLLAHARTFFIVLGAARTVALLRVAEGALLLLPLLWVLITQDDFITLIIGNIAVMGALALVALCALWRVLPARRPDPALLKRYLRYGVAAMPAGYACWILNLSDRFFISSYLNLSELGVYASVYSLGYIVINLFFNPFWAMYPAQAAHCYNEGRLDDLNKLYRHSTRMATVLVIPALVGLSVLGPAILGLLTTPDFLHGARLLPFISVAYVLSMYSSYFSINLGLIQKPHLTTYTLYAAAGCNIVLNVILIPQWGIMGAAVATLAAFGLQFLIEWILSRRLYRKKLGFDGLAFAKSAGGSLAMALVLYGCGLDESPTIWTLTGSVALGALVYIASQLALKTITGGEFRQLFIMAGCSGLLSRFPLRGLAAYLDGTDASKV